MVYLKYHPKTRIWIRSMVNVAKLISYMNPLGYGITVSCEDNKLLILNGLGPG